jgi:multiple antibiotic resistance protein
MTITVPEELFLLLIAVSGPFKVTIVCAFLTATASPEFIQRVALRTVLYSASVFVVFILLGGMLLRVFHVSVPAFQVGGGIILILFAVETITSRPHELHDESTETACKDPSLDIAAYPLAIPLMASPAALVAVTSTIVESQEWAPILKMVGVIVGIHVLNFFSLRSCRHIVAVVNPEILMVAAKVLSVVLTGLAVELILAGITQFEPIAAALKRAG